MWSCALTTGNSLNRIVHLPDVILNFPSLPFHLRKIKKMLSVKLIRPEEIRRISVNRDSLSIDGLLALARNVFPQIAGKQFQFQYEDDEKDLVTVSSRTSSSLLRSHLSPTS